MVWLGVAVLSNPELRILDIFVGAVWLTGWWLTGMVVLGILWVVAYVHRARRQSG